MRLSQRVPNRQCLHGFELPNSWRSTVRDGQLCLRALPEWRRHLSLGAAETALHTDQFSTFVEQRMRSSTRRVHWSMLGTQSIWRLCMLPIERNCGLRGCRNHSEPRPGAGLGVSPASSPQDSCLVALAAVQLRLNHELRNRELEGLNSFRHEARHFIRALRLEVQHVRLAGFVQADGR